MPKDEKNVSEINGFKDCSDKLLVMQQVDEAVLTLNVIQLNNEDCVVL